MDNERLNAALSRDITCTVPDALCTKDWVLVGSATLLCIFSYLTYNKSKDLNG
jgi:hypothetical protein